MLNITKKYHKIFINLLIYDINFFDFYVTSFKRRDYRVYMTISTGVLSFIASAFFLRWIRLLQQPFFFGTNKKHAGRFYHTGSALFVFQSAASIDGRYTVSSHSASSHRVSSYKVSAISFSSFTINAPALTLMALTKRLRKLSSTKNTT